MRISQLFRYRLVLPFYVRVYWPLAARYVFFARLYYFAFDRAFGSEFKGVLAGKYRYYRKNADQEANLYLLKRNIHRLEKGLMMRPRRPVFATSYIEQAVSGLGAASECGDNMLIRWAHDVLAEYFAATNRNPATHRARSQFDAISAELQQQLGESSEASIPYVLKKEPTVTLDQFRQLAQNRRSVRWFSSKKVDRSLVEEAMEVALLSPSACNRQPFKFVAFDDSESIQAVASIPAGTAGFAENIPFLVAIVGQLDAFATETDRHLIYIDSALTAMSFMYALETQGLSTCPINWPSSTLHDIKFQNTVGTGEHERVVMLMAVGYQNNARQVARSQKSMVHTVLTYGNHPSPVQETNQEQ